MRVLIMSDMEGVSGIVVWEQVNGGAPLYEEGRRLYTQEINAAVRGAKAAGATEIVVVDCHGAGGGWTFNSLLPELLHPDCEWVAHHAWSRYTEILEQGCDAALLSACTRGPAHPTGCFVTRSPRRRGGIYGSMRMWSVKPGSTPRCAGIMAVRRCWSQATRPLCARREHCSVPG